MARMARNTRVDSADDQTQSVERSPGPGKTQSVVDEHTATSNTQASNGLSGGNPRGGPERTPERTEVDEGRNPTLPGDEAKERTTI